MLRVNSRWLIRSLGIVFAIVGLLHLIAWLFSVFVYHATLDSESAQYFFPVYGRLGTTGVWLFSSTIIIDFIAAVQLVGRLRRHRAWALIAGIANLPVIPLGTAIGVASLVILKYVRSDG